VYRINVSILFAKVTKFRRMKLKAGTDYMKKKTKAVLYSMELKVSRGKIFGKIFKSVF